MRPPVLALAAGLLLSLAAHAQPIPRPQSMFMKDRPSLLIHPLKGGIGKLTLSAAKKLDVGSLSGKSLSQKALKYLLEGDKAAAAEAVEGLLEGPPDQMALLGRWLIERALAFDWVYPFPDFTQKKKDEVMSNMRAGIDSALAEVGMRGNGPQRWGYCELVSSACLCALSLKKEKGGPKRLSQVHDLFVKKVCPYMAGVGGVRAEGGWIGAQKVLLPALLYMWARSGVDNRNEMSSMDRKFSAWITRCGEWLCSAMRPDWTLSQAGDGPRDRTTQSGFSHVLAILEQTGQSVAIQQRSMGLPRKWGESLDKDDLWYHVGIMSQPQNRSLYRGRRAPLGRMFSQKILAHYFGRSADSDEKATWVSFVGGRFQSTGEHLDRGHFEIYRRDALAADNGWTMAAKLPDGLVEYTRSTAAHNCLLLTPPGGSPQMQQFTAKSKGGKIIHWKPGKKADVITADLTRAYKIKGLKSYRRQLIYVRPGTVIVCDTVTTDKPGWELAWLLQARKKPVLADGALTVTTDKSRMTCHAIAPEKPRIELVDGPVVPGSGTEPPKVAGIHRGEFRFTTTETETTLLFVLQTGTKDAQLDAPKSSKSGTSFDVTVGKTKITIDGRGKRQGRVR